MEKENKKLNIVLKIIKIVLKVILCILLIVLLIVFGLRLCNYINHKIKYKNGVNETKYIDINGQKQYVMMMGKNKDNPVILYLHGGPSSPDTYITYSFSDYLTNDYTVISWDQRGCGRTYYKNEKIDPDNESASFEQALKDVDVLVDYIRNKFNQDKVIIMGHSYGSILGSTYVRNNPNKVSAYIGIGQMVSLREADIYSYNDALNKAKAQGDDTTELESAYNVLINNINIQNLLKLRSLTSKYHPVEKEGDEMGLALFSPYAGINDLKWFFKQLGNINEYVELNKQLFDYVISFDATKEILEYKVPVLFISGGSDWVCPVDSTREYYESIVAPKKDMITIDKYGHDVHVANPKKFTYKVKEFLK